MKFAKKEKQKERSLVKVKTKKSFTKRQNNKQEKHAIVLQSDKKDKNKLLKRKN